MLDPSLGEMNLPLFEHLPVGVMLFRLVDPVDDSSLTFVGFNPAAKQMLPLELQPLLGKRMSEAFPLIPPQRRHLYAEAARNHGNRTIGETTWESTPKPAHVFHVNAVGMGGQLVAVLIENVTELNRLNDFLDAIVENVPHMLFVKDAHQLRFERLNRAGEELLGLPREKLLGKNDFDFFPDWQARFFQERDRDTLTQKTVVDIPEEPIETPRGLRWLHTRKVPILDADGNPQHLLGISEDITERKVADERMRELVRRLEESNAELDGFSYSVSHDLRAPLRAIDGFARVLMEDHGEKLGDEGRRVLGVIAKNAVKMGRLIDDLLAFSRLSRQPLTRRPVDMTLLARAAADDAREPGRDIEFVISELPVAHGDAALLEQVWLNLLRNAVKYTRNRQKAVIEVTGIRRGNECTYQVKDNGVGFDPRYETKLFGVFQRLHAASDYEGTGVGLALVHRIVHRHGGEIRAEGVPEKGATFIFSLPAQGG